MVNTINGTNGNDNLVGTDFDDDIFGKGGNDTISGGRGDDFLYGQDGDDSLFGGLGVNDFFGGAGNDRFAMTGRSDAGFSDDLIRDFVKGADTVDVSSWGISDFGQIQAILTEDAKGRAAFNAYFDGFDHVLRFSGLHAAQLSASDFAFSNAGPQDETGTQFDDVMFGSSGNDTLRGTGGHDILLGGDGNDTLSGGIDLDRFDGGAGFDRLAFTYSNEAVDVDLAKGRASFVGGGREFFTSIEAVTGSSAKNTLLGDANANSLDGYTGNDTLNGRLGADTLTGGGAADRFVFDTALGPSNVDTITDFLPGADEIRLAHAIFTTIPVGNLAAAAFAVNDSGAALDASDRIIYSNSTGGLYYDADGAGGVASKLFAILDPGLGASISAGDFLVI